MLTEMVPGQEDASDYELLQARKCVCVSVCVCKQCVPVGFEAFVQ